MNAFKCQDPRKTEITENRNTCKERKAQENIREKVTFITQPVYTTHSAKPGEVYT